jgi:hypothetical protein
MFQKIDLESGTNFLDLHIKYMPLFVLKRCFEYKIIWYTLIFNKKY